MLRSFQQGSESQVHVVLANALVAEGKYKDAVEALAQWDSPNPDPADEALAAQLRAEALHRGRLGDDQTIHEAATRAVSLAERSAANLTLIRALQVWAEVSVEAGRPDDAEEAGRRAALVASGSRTPECRALAELTGGYCLFATGRLDEAVTTFSAALVGLSALGLQVELRRVSNGLGICYTGLARIDDALRSFASSLTVAQKLGDRTAVCNTWANIAVACHEAGRFRAAAKCFEHAIDLLPPTSRVAAPLYGGATRLWMEFGDFTLAEQYAATAVSAGRESGLWRLVVDALCMAADLHLARGEPENAWPLVQEAVALTQDRSHLLNDPGQFARLRRHFVWVTQGYESLLRLDPERRIMASVNLSDRLQLRAFDDWISREEGESRQEHAADEIIRRGLFGILSRLMAVGVRFRAIPDHKTGEPSAQLVARVFQPEQRVALPLIDDLLQPGDARPRSA